MFIWALVDLLLNSAKHISKFRVNMRSKYLLQEIEKIIIEKVNKKGSKLVVSGDGLKTRLEWRGDEALLWFTVPFPNIEEGSQSSTVRIMQN